MICNIAVGTSFNCDDIKNAAGTEYWAYVFNRQDMTITYDGTGLITNIVPVGPALAYRIEGPQKAIDGMFEMQKSDGGGTISYKLTVEAMVSAMTQADINALEGLTLANDLVFVIPTKGKRIYAFGVDGGMVCESTTGALGKTGTENNLAIVKFTGESNRAKVEVLSTNYATTMTMLEGLLV